MKPKTEDYQELLDLIDENIEEEVFFRKVEDLKENMDEQTDKMLESYNKFYHNHAKFVVDMKTAALFRFVHDMVQRSMPTLMAQAQKFLDMDEEEFNKLNQR